MGTVRVDLSRRRLLFSAVAALAAACGSSRVALPTLAPEGSSDELDVISREITSGGPPPDGIPPVEKPEYVSIAEASKRWRDDSVMDALTIDGQPRAYPRMITVWHEIVNETMAGKPLALTYCPLTGSTLVFSGALANGTTTTFGTSGMLYNSNLVMYDRATNSLWPQLFGTAVRGARRGERLREIPGALTTTFGRWRARFPDGVVLSTDTGHVRAYGSSPYGDYDTSSGVMFPVRHRDERFHPKKVVVGVRHEGAALAIPKAELAAKRVANAEVGGRAVVAVHDSDLDAVRVFDRTTGKGVLRFALRDGAIVDEQTGTRWTADGRGERGELANARLAQLSAYDVMWFAWSAFNPNTAVLG
jgi:hypothetical protein